MRHTLTRIISKRPALLCMVCLAILLFSPMPAAKAQGIPKLRASAVEAEGLKDGSAAVALNLEDNPGLWGMRIKVTFDASVLTLVSAESGGLFGKDDLFLPERKGGGQLVFLAVTEQMQDVKANGTLATLHFQVAEGASAQACPVTVEVLEAVNFSGVRCEVDTADGIAQVDVPAAQENADKQEEAAQNPLPLPGTEKSTPAYLPQPPQNATGGGRQGNPLFWIVLGGIVLTLAAGGSICWYILKKDSL